jgi:replicative DNA helicase
MKKTLQTVAFLMATLSMLTACLPEGQPEDSAATTTAAPESEQEVSIISRTLKGLAKELDIPVIALSQLSRAVEKRDSSNSNVDGKKPLLSDLRESGAIEQDADMVCFIHRPEYYKLYDDGNGKDLRGLGQIIVAKHRNGATDEIWLRFIGKYTRFQNENDAFEDDLYANVTYATQSSKMNMLPQEAEGAKLDDDITPF